jgi:hypothetical protein
VDDWPPDEVDEPREDDWPTSDDAVAEDWRVEPEDDPAAEASWPTDDTPVDPYQDLAFDDFAESPEEGFADEPCAPWVAPPPVLPLRTRISVGLPGPPVLTAFCDTGRTQSVIYGQIVVIDGATGLALCAGATLWPVQVVERALTLDLTVGGCQLPGVRLEVASGAGPADLVLGLDVLAGRFLVDAAAPGPTVS